MKASAKATKRFSRFDPVGKPRKTKVRLGLLTGFMLLLAGVGLGVMNLYFGTGRYKLKLLGFYFEDLGLVALNVLPFVMLIFLLWALTNRAWISFLGTGVFTLIYSWAEYWKLMGRSDPIIAEDLTIISEGLEMGGKYIMLTWQIVFSAVLVLAGTLVFFFFFRGRLPKLLPRFGIAALLIAASLLLYNNLYTSKDIYSQYPVWKGLNRWIDSNKFISRGCMYPFLYSIRSAGAAAPDGYDAAEAERTLRAYPTDDIPEERKVNVLVVMLEAFADLSEETDRITLRDPYESYHALRAESVHGSLITDIFAAGTIKTERSVLTGFSRLTDFRRASWSYARYFDSQGYAVSGSHPSYESFYNRKNVNSNLGISRYYFRENHYEPLYPADITPDAILLPEILKLCRQDLESSPYVFSFNVTYQNHGPYPADQALFSEPYVPSDGIDEASYHIINNYLWGVEDTGNRMLEMAEELRGDEAPWVVVFFGDHKPWLGDQHSVYGVLGIDLERQTDESFYTYYGTEYLIWANNAAKEKLGGEFAGEGPAISPCYLMNILFARCGWEGPSFLKLSNEVLERLPIVSSKDRYLENGALVPWAELSEPSRALYQKLRCAEFYLMRDSGGTLPAAR